jgi:hypothetical protein
MPGIDGFDTMRALERSGSRAAVVFLSLLDDHEHVGEALRLGGRGFVVKSRMVRELEVALHHALASRRVVPALPPLLDGGAGGQALHVHAGDDAFADALIVYFNAALQRGDATCLVGTRSVRDRVAKGLQQCGWDVAAGAGPRYRVLDVHDVLSELLCDGMPDPGRLAQVVEDLDDYRRGGCLNGSTRLTLAGNLAGTLHAEGNDAGALAIERLWNRATSTRPFFTVCGYAASCFSGHTSEAFERTTGEHRDLCLAGEL